MNKECEAFTKIFRAIKPFFTGNCNFGCNLKTGHLWPKMGIRFIDYNDTEIAYKKSGLQDLKVILSPKKWDQPEWFWLACEVAALYWKLLKNPI